MTERVALLSASLLGGGAERIVVNLARGFAERGLAVDLVLAKAEGPYLRQVPPDVEIVDLQAHRVLSSLPALVRYLQANKPAALISALDYVNVVALWAKRLSGVSTKVVVTVHTGSCYELTNNRNVHTSSRLMRYLERRFYPWAERVVAVSQCIAKDLVEASVLSPDKVNVVYNPVIIPELFIQAQEQVPHPWFNQPAESIPVILSVGRLAHEKDHATLIRAFAQVRARRAARLMILGEGEQRPVLENLAGKLGVEHDVALPGFVANPYAYMARAAAFVLSSRFEGLPTALIEALALGAPVVSTDCKCGPAEILGGGRYGQLIPIGDQNALVRAMEGCLANSRREHGREAWTSFDLDTAVERYLDIIGSPRHA